MAQTTEQQNPVTTFIETTGDLAKSVGRFSLAMSMLAARQMISLVSPAKERGSAPLENIAKAAGNQLSGAVRTAFAVGTNVQSGIVDTAFNLAGYGAQGQKPVGSTSGLAIPLTAGATRRVAGVRTVASGALDRPVPQSEFVERLTAFHSETTGGAVERERTVIGLWKSEGLSTTIGKRPLPDNSLNDPRLPRDVLPIAHVGFGSGSTESLVFDVPKLNALFAARCHPSYRGFSYEGIGAILRIYERGFFKVMSGTLGLIHLDAPDGPNPAGFFSDYLQQFPQDLQRLITHGYGRIVAFSNMNIYKAIEEATSFPPERVEPAVHGAGFAFAFMNIADMPRILEQSAIPFDPLVRTAFQNGLVFSLVFFDWYAPGLLQNWQPVGPLETEMIDHARREAAGARQRGFPLAFRLEQPRG